MDRLRTAAAAILTAALLGGCGFASEATGISAPDQPAAAGSTEVSLSDRHPNGAVLAVTGVEVRARSVAIDVSLVNGFPEDIRLNARGLWVIDDQGNAYAFAEPAENAQLAVGPGEELSGRLVFLGEVPPAVSALTVLSNVPDASDGVDVADRNDRSTTPEFLVEEIPVP